MKKVIMIILLIVIFLSGCTEVSLEYLEFELNPGLDTIEVNSEFVDAGATASYGLKTLTVTILENQVDTTQTGVYEIIYQTTHRDLVQTLVRIVTVTDQTAPVVSLNPGIDTLLLGELWIDAGVDAFDNSENELTFEVIGEVLNQVGDYTITYRVTDPSGNVTEVIRVVHVIE